ncbi:MAG: transcription-repair coupling factor [Firmicutes bacterium]|nr:transcription-repair coupling factor [Bacillota bacterium]
MAVDIFFTGKAKRFLDAARQKNVSAFGLRLGERVLLSSRLEGAPLVYICADSFSAKQAYAQFLCTGRPCILLEPRDDVLGYRRMIAGENAAARLFALTQSVLNSEAAIITCVEAVLQIFPRRGDFIKHILHVETGKEYAPQELAKSLVMAGYRRSGAAQGGGEFSLRGDILDILPHGCENGYRLEFFGDTLESIRAYDPFDLKPAAAQKSLFVGPATEVFYNEEDADALLKRVVSEIPVPQSDADKEGRSALIAALSSDIAVLSRDMRLAFLLPLLPHTDFNAFFMPKQVVFDDAKAVFDQIGHVYSEHEARYKEGLLRGALLRASLEQLVPQKNAAVFSCPQTAFHAHDSQNRLFSSEAAFHFRSTALPAYHRNYDALYDDVKAWLGNGYLVTVFCGNETVKDNVTDFFARQNPLFGAGSFFISAEYLAENAVFHEEKIILIATPALVAGGKKTVIKRRKSDVFTQPAIGAYVVHQYHGIGFCESVTCLSLNGVERDYAVILYEGGDKLYVPVENMDSLSRYGCEGDAPPRLSRIGGAEFARVKARVREAVSKMAVDLAALYAERAELKGHAYSENNELLDAFAADFPHNETEDQLTAAEECIADLTSGKIMDRLLCGDVGYGKTEVALRAAFKVACEDKQTAFLSPTTILARQHYETAKKRFEPFGVTVASLTRFDPPKKVAETLQAVAAGKIDVVCGTHRLLSRDVVFKDLGLLILDEEQRFGVADKEKIKALKPGVNVLTLSATPIPRTLHLSLSGIRDISLLDTPPENRLPVKTYVTEYSDGLLYDAVSRELNRGGQVFIVYNRVADIDRFAARVKSIIDPGASIAVAHGQMGAEALENTVAAFSEGKKNILIASAIIENGIDMPNANTMLVLHADCFGLSQLYQLRGRVGRSNRLAHVYFTYDSQKKLTDDAYKRLDAITQFTEFGSGFKIAMRDLEIRGAGNILGRAQHGHIERVGYDMYQKILSEAVAKSSNKAAAGDTPDVLVTTDFNAFIPEEYIPDKDLRLAAYVRISRVDSIAAKKSLTDEIMQIYGALPAAVDNLILIALYKNLAARIGAQSVVLKKAECGVKFNKTAQIPKSVLAFPSAKIDPSAATVWFGADRAALLKFLGS